MNLPFDRGLLAHIVIAVALCAGGWFFFVQPKSAALCKLEAAVSEQTIQPFANDGSAERFAQRIESLRAQVIEIEERNELSRDSSELYRVIMILARDHDVEVQTLRPGNDRNALSDTSIATVPFNVAVTGGYRQVAEFIDAVDGMSGFVRATSLAIDPINEDGQALVSARFGFEVVAFNLPESLSRLAGVTDAVE